MKTTRQGKRKVTQAITVEIGQDTPAYAHLSFRVAQGTPRKVIIEQAKQRAQKALRAGALVFEPSWDFSGLRIVSIHDANDRMIAEDIDIEPQDQVLGNLCRLALEGHAPLSVLLMEAERQNIAMDPKVRAALVAAAKRVG